MTVVTRSVLWSNDVPRGWKVVSLMQGRSLTFSTFYLSPEGRRFASIEAAKEHLASQVADLSDTEGNDFIHSPRRRKRKLSGDNFSGAKRLKFDNDINEDDIEEEPISLPIEIQRRRKLMAARSPFRNLLKRTLVRNHVRLHGRGTWRTQTPVQKVNTPPPPSSPPAKRVKCYDPPAPMSPPVTPPPKVSSVASFYELPETPPKTKVEFEKKTPPRNPRRQSMLFTPPNLTPPVTRRHSVVTFSPPNQRPLSARSARSQPNFNV